MKRRPKIDFNNISLNELQLLNRYDVSFGYAKFLGNKLDDFLDIYGFSNYPIELYSIGINQVRFCTNENFIKDFINFIGDKYYSYYFPSSFTSKKYNLEVMRNIVKPIMVISTKNILENSRALKINKDQISFAQRRFGLADSKQEIIQEYKLSLKRIASLNKKILAAQALIQNIDELIKESK